MPERSDRDSRRWTAYERLAGDASASPSERTQARDRLAELRARYPNGRPAPPGERRYSHAAGWARRAGWPFGFEAEDPPPEDPAVQRAREAAEARAQAEAVRQQRANVERVPGWERNDTLQELRACEAAWTPDEHRRFKEQRARLTGSSRAVDL